jgi:hypothetical protein
LFQITRPVEKYFARDHVAQPRLVYLNTTSRPLTGFNTSRIFNLYFALFDWKIFANASTAKFFEMEMDNPAKEAPPPEDLTQANEHDDPRYTEEELMEKLKDIYGIMEVFKTRSATSLQRAYPAALCNGTDHSDRPLQGDYTRDLFLAHRNGAQPEIINRRAQRRLLEGLLPSGMLGEEMLAELEELRNAEDAESELSDNSMQNVTFMDEQWAETKFQTSSMADVKEGTLCPFDCPLRKWQWTVPSKQLSQMKSPGQSLPDSNLNTQIYETLPNDHFRILEILPGFLDAPVELKLHICSLNDLPAFTSKDVSNQGESALLYEALSYCWGPPDDKRAVVACNNTPMSVQANLFSAICYLRRPEKSRFVWTDALAINQKDNEEKARQVRIMYKIYKRASRVIVWLGDGAAGGGEDSLRFLFHIDKFEFRKTVLKCLHSKSCLANLHRLYSGTQELLAHPWFKRTWIRQELAAGRKATVLCGRQNISWGTLKRATGRLGAVRSKLSSECSLLLPKAADMDTLQYLKRGWNYGQSAVGREGVAGSLNYWHGGGLLELLVIGCDFEATDPRDKIYALLGLAREPLVANDPDAIYPHLDEDEILDPFVIDYNMSVSEVYQNLVKYFINRDLNLDIILFAAGIRNEASSGLPSWTPDWRTSDMSLPPGYDMRFDAGSYTRALKQEYTEHGKLQIQGYNVDTVNELLPFTADAWNFLHEKTEDIILSHGSMENKTMLGGQSVHDYREGAHRYRCCLTTTGRVSLVPKATQIGDHMYVSLGAKMPLVLRQIKHSQDGKQDNAPSQEPSYKLIGVSLHPGFMQGEVFSKFKVEDAEDLILV